MLVGRADSLWMVLTGAMVLLPPAGGRRAADRVIGPGETFGLDAPNQPDRSAGGAEQATWMRALIASRLLEVDATALERACGTDPSIALGMVDLIRARAAAAERRVQWSLRLSAEGRLRAELFDLAERFGVPSPGGGLRIAVPLTQDLLANLTGGARETVNRSLRALAARGEVERNGLTYTVFPAAPSAGAGANRSGSDGSRTTRPARSSARRCASTERAAAG